MEPVSLWLPSHPGGQRKRSRWLSLVGEQTVRAGQVSFYLMTLAHDLPSFHRGVQAVGHMEQEDPGPGGHTLDIHTSLQLEANTHTHTVQKHISVERLRTLACGLLH